MCGKVASEVFWDWSMGGDAIALRSVVWFARQIMKKGDWGECAIADTPQAAIQTAKEILNDSHRVR